MYISQVDAAKQRNPAIIVTRFPTTQTTLLLHSEACWEIAGRSDGQDIDFSNTLYWSEVSATEKTKQRFNNLHALKFFLLLLF
jgi:hypothetical protein